MKTIFRNALAAGTLVASTALITATVVSQDAPPDMDAMMDAWAALAEPGPQHEKLARGAGAWKSVSTHWMYPGADPEVSETRAFAKPVMDGRFIVQRIEGKMNMGGEPQDFEGMGIYGYDNGTKKYVYSWIDNFGTMIMNGVGEEDADGNIVYMAKFPDPTTGATMRMKSIMKFVNDDKNIYEIHMDMGDGNMFKSMEIVSTRADGEQLRDGDRRPDRIR